MIHWRDLPIKSLIIKNALNIFQECLDEKMEGSDGQYFLCIKFPPYQCNLEEDFDSVEMKLEFWRYGSVRQVHLYLQRALMTDEEALREYATKEVNNFIEMYVGH